VGDKLPEPKEFKELKEIKQEIKREKSDSRSRSHWYNPAIPLDDITNTPRPERKGSARERMRRRREDRYLPKVDWSWGVIALAVVGIVGVVGLIMLFTSRSSAEGNVSANALTPMQGDNAPNSSFPIELPDIQAWDGQRRVTILLMGIDKRPGEEGTGFRTDTLILISIDPTTRSVGMLSILRDLYMPLPGRDGLQAINTAYVIGELERPGYGPRLAAETIEYNFGIKVDHYVVVSFDAMIAIVDAMDGIDIDVPEAINDLEFPAMVGNDFEPLYIPAGRIHMDGALALKYARTRHQGDDDYDRTTRQQQVLFALRQKALDPQILATLVGQAPTLWNEVSRGIVTDLTFDQLLSLAWYVKDIPDENFRRGRIERKYITAIQYANKPVITVDRNLIAELMLTVFGETYNAQQ
jgi:LCP family protein required for cell wall assembly